MIDYARLHQALLPSLRALLEELLPDGRLEGNEFVARNPTRDDHRPGSFKINLVTGLWSDFATGERGRDVVSLLAYLRGCRQSEAASELVRHFGLDPAKLGIERKAGQTRLQDEPRGRENEISSTALHVEHSGTSDSSSKNSPRARWVPLTPVPSRAPPALSAHFKHGRPTMRWIYRDAHGDRLGYVFRFDLPGGKQIVPLVFARNSEDGTEGWKWRAFAVPRPLYGLDRLAAVPDRPVLLVEGEKCVDAAQAELGEAVVVVTWPGGAKAVDNIDFSALRGRHVTLWPDADAQCDRHGALLPVTRQPGAVAMAKVASVLRPLGCELHRVKLPPPGSHAPGWDVADAIADGLRGDALFRYLSEHSEPYPAPVRPADAILATTDGRTETTDADWAKDLKWRQDRYEASKHNVAHVLLHHPAWTGLLAYNEFEEAVTKLRPPPWPGGKAGEWKDFDDTQFAIWLEGRNFGPMASATVAEAVEVVARRHCFHPVRDYLESLRWDGTDRLDHWLIDCVGAADAEYAHKVGRYFLMGMVRRVFEPGCKFDYMLVLEGPQGHSKTTVLEVLGGAWFGNTDLHLGDKDSILGLRGIWLQEFAELDSLQRVEATRQKSFISRQFDSVRPPYGRRTVRCPRQVVFAGTTNQSEWNKDPTGGRRFWSIAVGAIDLARLRDQRDQLFAEALHRWRAGEMHYPDAAEQKRLFDPEQQQRIQTEVFDEMLAEWWRTQSDDEYPLHKIISDALKVPAGQMQTVLVNRVATSLKRLGCVRVEHRTKSPRYVYRRPPELAAGSGTPNGKDSVTEDQHDDDVPF